MTGFARSVMRNHCYRGILPLGQVFVPKAIEGGAE
jgi:hypothetical protein